VPRLAPIFRCNGGLVREGQPLSAASVDEIVARVATPAQLAHFRRTGDLDAAYAFPGGGRFRMNLCRGRDGSAATFRVVKAQVASLEALGVPEGAARLTEFAQGLVLVTGPSGAGKTTTLFSLVELVNRDRPDHIITVEDPIEFRLEPARCQVSQRELGAHTASFEAALRGALREDPDIIVIGDLRDHATTAMAISAAETGHLVFGSMHAMSAIKSLDKLLDMFPPDEQAQVRTMVSESLRGILCQHLLPGVDGQRVLAAELLLNSVGVGNIIRDGNTANLRNAMQLGRSQGMCTLEDAVRALAAARRIAPATAAAVLGHA
jgi:twitching motility protein PilT